MKILTVSLIVILLFILCIYLEKFETFYNPTSTPTISPSSTTSPSPTVCISKNIDLAQCNDNDINNKLINNKIRLDKIPTYKNTNYKALKNILTNTLETPYSNSEFNLSLNQHKLALNNLENQLKNMSNNSIFDNLKNTTDYKSVKSQGSYQSLNLQPLDNDKYFISLNGKGKCLESSTLNKNKSIKCNTQNPNQHFDLNIISDLEMYKKQLTGNYSDEELTSHITKYPFAILKSSSGNCVGTKDGSLIIGPCINTVHQRWAPSKHPITCK
jgi:hypothetical protein